MFKRFLFLQPTSCIFITHFSQLGRLEKIKYKSKMKKNQIKIENSLNNDIDQFILLNLNIALINIVET
ncbi:hypothetical protein TTHERM_00812740 (macronuclear) [Tetrahymena thermophila SB210]|uniref:Uncharacterized protein n=1 Tax=Tetrahymena thermophila (strain SB210) TaxID=312017 RepID=Q22SV7_TETTS|nr:hypothetical protein TTHERM_00812740 [Tetrahymena thermophila SB210]EAR88357.1 hypothetical protein TTHERM_00812740 [Tetrahymena thermophila SB210]|eukprot:XP_001008602.1 hypothetical protein TTHERM_00812740 [Tetrahymena thermophila SB210]